MKMDIVNLADEANPLPFPIAQSRFCDGCIIQQTNAAIDLLAAVKARHWERESGACAIDREAWPCAEVKAADALARLLFPGVRDA